MKELTIGKVARLAGVGVETVRFYERKELIAEPPRLESGYRQYPEEAVSRIRFIRRAKELGFSLSEIGELLSLRSDPKASCADVKARTESKIRDVGAKIRSLQRMKRALTKFSSACTGKGVITECPILEALDDQKGVVP